MSMPMVGCNTELNGEKKAEALHINKADSDNQPVGLMTLDLLGFVFILLGLAQQYGRIDVLPHSLSFSYSGLAVVMLGLVMTLPFLAWTLQSSATALDKISL